MNNLTLRIKKEYFNQILYGTKKFEYRIVKDYWTKRIVNKEYDTITFINGYKSNSPVMIVEYLGYDITTITHEFFGNTQVLVYALKLGKIISTKYLNE
jgi:ASC-1-like (ASCH) protein